jgi:hypothetical protein
MDVFALPDVADRLGVGVTRVNQLVRDGQLVAVTEGSGPRVVPALFIQDGTVVKHLPSVITVLRDAHFSDEEIVDWLYRLDDSLAGSPIVALRENRSSEVKRRAQVAGY